MGKKTGKTRGEKNDLIYRVNHHEKILYLLADRINQSDDKLRKIAADLIAAEERIGLLERGAFGRVWDRAASWVGEKRNQFGKKEGDADVDMEDNAIAPVCQEERVHPSNSGDRRDKVGEGDKQESAEGDNGCSGSNPRGEAQPGIRVGGDEEGA